MAKKKIYPTLWSLFRDNLLPNKTIFYGYARSNLTVAQLRAKCDQYMQVAPGDKAKYEQFWQLNYFVAGAYDSSRDFKLLDQKIAQFEKVPHANRIFYLALPSVVFETVTRMIKDTCMSKK